LFTFRQRNGRRSQVAPVVSNNRGSDRVRMVRRGRDSVPVTSSSRRLDSVSRIGRRLDSPERRPALRSQAELGLTAAPFLLPHRHRASVVRQGSENRLVHGATHVLNAFALARWMHTVGQDHDVEVVRRIDPQ